MTHLPAFLRTGCPARGARDPAVGRTSRARPDHGRPGGVHCLRGEHGHLRRRHDGQRHHHGEPLDSTAERDSLLEILRLKGQEAFFNALKNAKRVGTLRTPESVGYDLRLAYDEPGKDGGRRILIATDRPIGFTEARVRPPSIDYPLTVIDMTLSPEGKGEGTMSVAAKLIPTGKNIVVENYDTQPVRLNRIESRKLVKR